MKSILIAFDQAHYEVIVDLLERMNCRGFTGWREVEGRGSRTGDPHYGTHAWPSLGSAIITVVDDTKVAPLLERLKALDEASPLLGLRAFVWNVEQCI